MYYAVHRSNNYLEHHGIKGQKWGVRNGPPYPLKKQKNLAEHIPAMSKHAEVQAKKRGVSEADIVDAIKNPIYTGDTKTDDQGRKSTRVVGEKATVNVNPDNDVITTVWKTGTKQREKYTKGDK